MRINFAHLRERSTTGGWINVAVFDTRSASGTASDNARLLAQLTARARAAGLAVDQSALMFAQHGRQQFYGDSHLVTHLSRTGAPQCTHSLDG